MGIVWTLLNVPIKTPKHQRKPRRPHLLRSDFFELTP